MVGTFCKNLLLNFYLGEILPKVVSASPTKYYNVLGELLLNKRQALQSNYRTMKVECCESETMVPNKGNIFLRDEFPLTKCRKLTVRGTIKRPARLCKH